MPAQSTKSNPSLIQLISQSNPLSKTVPSSRLEKRLEKSDYRQNFQYATNKKNLQS